MPLQAPALAGGGDPKHAPAELVAVLGDARFAITARPASPPTAPTARHWPCPAATTSSFSTLERANTGASLLGHTGRVYRTAFSPDGKTLASVGYDGKVKVWTAGRAGEARPDGAWGVGRRFGLRPQSRRSHARFLRRRPRRAVGASPATGRSSTWGAADPARFLAADAHRPLVAAASKTGAVFIWDAATGQDAWSCPVPGGGRRRRRHGGLQSGRRPSGGRQ